MSFVASQARNLMLTAYRSDLQYRLQLLYFAKTQNMQTSSTFANNNPNRSSFEAQYFQDQNARMTTIDKAIDMEIEKVKVQLAAVSEELKAIADVIKRNIESGFGTFKQNA